MGEQATDVSIAPNVTGLPRVKKRGSSEMYSENSEGWELNNLDLHMQDIGNDAFHQARKRRGLRKPREARDDCPRK